ncbi:MAG TPA: MBL fold metallo-hydrolase [Bacillota bacterium]|jgi:ribonuclease BN (tRNA processing enzyme)|nr:MBL fold metallo-hydrolase [Bacillota bacterium]HOB87445.1 MBL fold metallo-hydrolase [Bacillota bacterium]HPT33271.1 MBL fold metallo-hydrolase [Bacillota bacterium]HPZ65265.1 MBL fold metallo-hydrolase [Bacillota bacterium]HQD06736.1 MBL fold metallo-hydrolase [Bacillota bacterium]
MKLTVLGCYGPYPPAGGACSGYLLEEGGTRVLIDCGNGVLSRLQSYCRLWELEAVVLSHLHSDHISDLFILRYALDVFQRRGLRREPLPLYAPPEPAAEFERLSYKSVYRPAALAAGQVLEIGPLTFRFAAAVHAVPCLAMRIQAAGKTLVYSGDTEYFSGLVDWARGADLFLCEANYLEKDMAANPPNHLSAAQAAQLAAEAGVKRLLLTHLPPEEDGALSLKEAREHFPQAEIAREGSSFEI